MADASGTKDQEIRTVFESGSFYIQIDRPAVKNAFSPSTYDGIKQGVLRGESMELVDSIVISGVRGAFGSGGDLKKVLEIVDGKSGNDNRLNEFEKSFSAPTPFQTMLRCNKPIVGLVDGYCLAGGLIVAMCCDAVLATEDSLFGVPEGRVGLTDPWVPEILAHHVGLMRAKHMMLTGEMIPAETASHWGLVTEIVPDFDSLFEAASRYVKLLRRTSPDSKAAYKARANNRIGSTDGVDSIRGLNFTNVAEGLRAFKGKFEPNWDPM